MSALDDLKVKLEAPFAAGDLEWKVQKCGVKRGEQGGVWALIVPFIDARAGQRRLDEVFGMDGWEVTYRPFNLGQRLEKTGEVRQLMGVIAQVKFRLPGSDRWVTREDAAEPSDYEPVKGGVSGAFKRVLVTLGIGRYLYGIDACWAQVVEDKKTPGAQRGTAKEKGEGGKVNYTDFYWIPDPRDVVRITGQPLPETKKASAPPPSGGQADGNGQPPRQAGGNPAPAAASAPAKAAAPSATGPVPKCPQCNGFMYDNRKDKRTANSPDFRCKDKDCGHGIWLDGKKEKAATGTSRGSAGVQHGSFDEIPEALNDDDDDLPF